MNLAEVLSEDRMLAAVELVGRTGGDEFVLRYSEPESDDTSPVGWLAFSRHGKHWSCAGAINPVRAVLRLAESLVDGGLCLHCNRPTGLNPDNPEEMPMDKAVCWYQYDPELKTFRRGCEGDT